MVDTEGETPPPSAPAKATKARWAPTDILEATTSFVALVDGKEYIVHQGRTHLQANHPLVAINPDNFKPVPLTFGVEQATEAPGEKRNR